MSERKPKRPRDLSQRAKMVVDIVTGQVQDQFDDGEDSAVVEFTRKGGKKGGKARASKLSPERRREIAQRGAAVHWGRDDSRNRGPQ